MTTRRITAIVFVASFLLLSVSPVGAAPTMFSETLRGPNNGVCAGARPADPVGTAGVQTLDARAGAASERIVRVTVAATVAPSTRYEVRLASTVVEESVGGTSVGCHLWAVGTVVSSAQGSVRVSGVVGVPAHVTYVQVYVGPVGDWLSGYATNGMPVG